MTHPPLPAWLPKPGETLLQRYRLDEVLGQGGQGVVYGGWHLTLQVPIALKVLMDRSESNVKRFEREAQLAAQLDHPNIVRLYDFGTLPGGEPYMVMKRLHGLTLGEELGRNGPLARPRLLALFGPCLEGLAEAHRRGVIHKDLKPDNLFLSEPRTPQERLCILDFGIARVQGPDPSSPAESSAGGIVGRLGTLTSGNPIGTPQYMAPEYLVGAAISPAVDVYQMGLILTEAATGQRVVDPSVNSVSELWLRCAMLHMSEDTVQRRVQEVMARDHALGLVALRACAHRPELRYPSARELGEALRSLVSEAAHKLIPIPPPSQSQHEAQEAWSPVLPPALPLEQAQDPKPRRAATQLESSLPPPARATTTPEPSSSPSATTHAREKSRAPWLLTLGSLGLAVALVGMLGIVALGLYSSAQEEGRPLDGSLASHQKSPQREERTPDKRADEVAPDSLKEKEPPPKTEATRATPHKTPAPLPTPRSVPVPRPNTIKKVPLGEGVRILPGSFWMGSPESEEGRSKDETLHEVRITRAFWMQTTETTQREWESLMGSNPSRDPSCPACPVDRTTWFEAVAYANLRSEAEGLRSCYQSPLGGPYSPDDASEVREPAWSGGLDCQGYRLPTEAEWEYAARAGTQGAHYGHSLGEVAWSAIDGDLPRPVAQKEPNAWGLYDTVGNQFEWCWDWLASYPKGLSVDPTGPSSGKQRVGRGGVWGKGESSARAALRGRAKPDNRSIGVRLVRTLPR